MRAWAATILFAWPLLAAIPANAQTASASCSFTRICQVQILCNSDTLNLRFSFDLETGDSVVGGNQGQSDVIIMQGFRAISFTEPLPSGAVQTTTVTTGGHALHSRHTTFDATSADGMVPSQYRGTCDLNGWP